MSSPQVPDHGSKWLNESGPDNDVVISSRVRLARNVVGYPFLTRASEIQKAELARFCEERITNIDFGTELQWMNIAEMPGGDRQLLVERHLISAQLSANDSPRGVAVSDDECISIMVNEEDHLRMQILRSGMQLESAYEQADRIDDALESNMDFAFSSKLGYLTACPTNVGTGIRVSVMLHLPALKLTGEIERLRRAAKEMHLAVRGFHGEGSEAAGDLYQVSNQTTLGKSERQILADFQDVIIPRMIGYERRAREAMLQDRQIVLDDRVWRAVGLLSNARLLNMDEALSLLSTLRMGITMFRISLPGVSSATLNELLVLSQPAHLQKMCGQKLDATSRRKTRAEFIRSRLSV